MNSLLSISRTIDRLNAFVGQAISWLVLAAVLISAGNAITRKLFALSSNGWLEVQWYLFSAVFLLAAGYTLLRGEHVKVDILYTALRRRTQIWIEIIGTVLFLLPFCAVTIWLSLPVAFSKYVHSEYSQNQGGLILWPVWALIPTGFVLLGLQGVSELIKRVAILRGRLPDPADEHDAEAAAH